MYLATCENSDGCATAFFMFLPCEVCKTCQYAPGTKTDLVNAEINPRHGCSIVGKTQGATVKMTRRTFHEQQFCLIVNNKQENAYGINLTVTFFAAANIVISWREIGLIWRATAA